IVILFHTQFLDLHGFTVVLFMYFIRWWYSLIHYGTKVFHLSLTGINPFLQILVVDMRKVDSLDRMVVVFTAKLVDNGSLKLLVLVNLINQCNDFVSPYLNVVLHQQVSIN